MLIIAAALAAVSALFWYVVIRNFWIATVCATITAVLAQWLVGGLHMGWFDDVFYENLVALAALSLVVSAAIGSAIRYLQHRQKANSGAL